MNRNLLLSAGRTASGGRVLYSKAERVCKPAEMLVLRLPKGKLDGLADGSAVELRINAH